MEWLDALINWAQAKTCAAILRLLLEKRNKRVVTWNIWNLSDRDSWKKEEWLGGCLFDRQYKAKLAYYALQRLLENPAQANETGNWLGGNKDTAGGLLSYCSLRL